MMNINYFNVGDVVQLKPEARIWDGQTCFGRLDFLSQYQILKFTKRGHILLQTTHGKTHYSVKLFNKVLPPAIKPIRKMTMIISPQEAQRILGKEINSSAPQ